MTTRLLPPDDWWVRRALLEDVRAIVRLGDEQLRELYPHESIDAERIDPLARTLISSPVGAVFVAESQGSLLGVIGGLIVQQPVTGFSVASELAWFVSKSARGEIGAALLRAFEDWARASGADRIHMMTPPGRVEAFYRRKGYHALEVTYEKRLTA